MAEEKKKPDIYEHHFQDTMVMLAILVFVSIVFQRFYIMFKSGGAALSFYNSWVAWFRSIWPVWKVLAFFISFFASLFIGINLYGRKGIQKAEEAIYGKAKEDVFLATEEDSDTKDKRWTRVIELINSSESSDWKLAIIEADVILESLLRANGYDGEGVGEMLKRVEPSDFLTLDAAWEAHKVRNRIAHSGSDFELNEREAKRVVVLFESVFREFQII
ncbi:MAG TPA: hypothetical protein VJJ48_00920 [Candidatus Paceibacterota bacterium]